MRPAERKVRVGEELDGVFDVSLPSGDVDETEFVDQITDLASNVSLVVGALAVRVQADFVRIEVAASAQASPRPVKEVLARRLNMNVPSVISCVVLAAVRVYQGLDKDGRVRERFILGLTENDSSCDGVREYGDRGDELLVVQVNVGAEPSFGHRGLVDNDRSAGD